MASNKFVSPPGIPITAWYWREECCPICSAEWNKQPTSRVVFDHDLYGGGNTLIQTLWCPNCLLSEHGFSHNCGDCGIHFFSWDQGQYLCKDHGGEW